MGKKRAKQNANSRRVEPQSVSRGTRAVAIALLALGGGVFLYALSQRGAPTPRVSPSATTASAPSGSRAYRYFENPEDARPFPPTLSPERFQHPEVANAYAIARQIPDVLVQQPCLCGCDNPSDNHRSLLDCYVDDHAATCNVCITEAVFAKKMTDAGKSGAWIRDAILRHEFSNVDVGSD